MAHVVAGDHAAARLIHRREGALDMSIGCVSNLPGPATMLVVSLFTLGAADAWAQDCRPVYAVGTAPNVVDCPAGHESDFCLIRTSLVDRGGLLTGRLEYLEDSSKGSKHPQEPSLQLYVGVYKITAEQGALEVEEHGIFDSNSLEFAGLGKITGGTGELAGFAGNLTDIGNAKGTMLITGTMCKE